MKKLIALLSLNGGKKHPGQTDAQYKALGIAYLKGIIGLTDEEIKELEQSEREREAWEQEAREQEAREQKAREQEAREQEARE